MLTQVKTLSALTIVAAIGLGWLSGSALAASADAAKKCAAEMVSAFPPREPGNPAAGSVNGTTAEQRSFYDKCIANAGNAEVAAANAPTPATGGNPFHIGDDVRFPSGGPKMRVIGIAGAEVICQWTTESGQVVSGTIPAAALASNGDFGNQRRTSSAPGAVRPRETENYPYRPCPASVTFANGRTGCLGYP